MHRSPERGRSVVSFPLSAVRSADLQPSELIPPYEANVVARLQLGCGGRLTVSISLGDLIRVKRRHPLLHLARGRACQDIDVIRERPHVLDLRDSNQDFLDIRPFPYLSQHLVEGLRTTYIDSKIA